MVNIRYHAVSVPSARIWRTVVRYSSVTVIVQYFSLINLSQLPFLAMLVGSRDGSVGPSVNRSVHSFGLDLHISTIIGWISMTFCTDIHDSRINQNASGDPLTSHLAPPSGQFSHIQWNISPSTRWVGTKFYTDIHGFQMMNTNTFGDPLTAVPHWGWQLCFWVKCLKLLDILP